MLYGSLSPTLGQCSIVGCRTQSSLYKSASLLVFSVSFKVLCAPYYFPNDLSYTYRVLLITLLIMFHNTSDLHVYNVADSSLPDHRPHKSLNLIGSLSALSG